MAMDFEQDNDKIKMLLEQMNKQQQQAKPLGQQSMGGGLFAPSKTDMGPIGGMADAVGMINPVAGAASKALLGAVDGASGIIGGVLDAPFRAIERVGRSIKGLRPIPPGERNGASSSAGSKMLGGGADLMGALVKQAGSTPASSQPPPSLSAPQQGSADWKPSPEANRIAIASAISPGAGMSQWGGEINAEADKNFDRNLEAKTLDAIVGAPPGHMGKPPSAGDSEAMRAFIRRGAYNPALLDDTQNKIMDSFKNGPPAPPPVTEEERRRRELLDQYNPYARRGINPG